MNVSVLKTKLKQQNLLLVWNEIIEVVQLRCCTEQRYISVAE